MTKEQDISENDNAMPSNNFGDDAFDHEKKEDFPPIEESISSDEIAADGDEGGVKEKGKREGSPHFAAFLSQLEQEESAEGKIRLSIAFMREALVSPNTPRFRDFWEGRRLSLPLFKENIPPKSRSELWGEYVEISYEARRLKEILDEQSAFAVEQIELAIQALEKDLEHYDVLLTHSSDIFFPEQTITLKDREGVYHALQRELQLLNTLAARINGLRKEVLKTEMRVRTKNKLFERLSTCGDRVFPRRKDLIKSISDEFLRDIENFVASHFHEEEPRVPLYALREEIKSLQAIAKILTLNTHAFTKTRLKLSECWDQIRHQEKERKKEFAQKKQAFRQDYDSVMEKIRAFVALCQTEISIDEANRQAHEILEFMKTISLARDEVQSLRDAMNRAKRPIFDRIRAHDQERIDREREMETKKRERINAVKDALQKMLLQVDNVDSDALTVQRDRLWKEFEALAVSKMEKQMIERLFKQLKDLIDEKKERVLMDLSEDDLKSLEKLKILLNERKERRQEIRDQLETYRKVLGGSGFDFEKAMMYREMIEAEKEVLDKINSSIDEIEEKISDIELR